MVQFIGDKVSARSYVEHPNPGINYFISFNFLTGERYQFFVDSNDWMQFINTLNLIDDPEIDEDGELTFNLKGKVKNNTFYDFSTVIPNSFDKKMLSSDQLRQFEGTMSLAQAMPPTKAFVQRKIFINLRHIDNIFIGWEAIAGFDAINNLPDKIDLDDLKIYFTYLKKNKTDSYILTSSQQDDVLSYLTSHPDKSERILFEDANSVEYSIKLDDLSVIQYLEVV